MNLILWRHAEAEYGVPDLERGLTDKGRQQADAAAKWLRLYLNGRVEVWASQALRSRQTAEALGLPYTVKPKLNPINRVEELPALIAAHKRADYLILVGHQPWLGQLCGYLLNGSWLSGQYWSVRKSGIWWFGVKVDEVGRLCAKLKAAMTPQLLLPGD
ncbi:phosphohistidine phosphatase [Eikenella sp. NML03-A-027]|uniref:SixA phosphatase family protein n=1 Tax=Eikenella sp. NML03-A-027 TaxID=1795828 RepID=UPI0007E07832|nr:histidine phosphatase family protein [Eikenella sp. NML03-A-027]OAM30439.1 phosphohistidine phosphatase [Eikenella sp. NML03-A-027]